MNKLLETPNFDEGSTQVIVNVNKKIKWKHDWLLKKKDA